jgi:hypothetical protein
MKRILRSIAFMVLPALAMLCAMPVYAQVDLTGMSVPRFRIPRQEIR